MPYPDDCFCDAVCDVKGSLQLMPRFTLLSCCVGQKQVLLWPRFMVASYVFSISFGVNIIQSMIADFNVCDLLAFSVDCKDKMLTLLSLS